jgi:hypothetical protein
MARPVRSPLLSAVTALALAACGSTASPSVPASAAPASPSATATASPSAVPSAPAATASWAKPANQATIKDYSVDLAAKASGPGVTGVAFTVKWKGGSGAACTSTARGADGTWSCTANLLKLHVLPGPISFSIDLVGSAGTPKVASRSAVFAVVPPKPNTTFTSVSKTENPDGSETDVDSITWTEPDGFATEFRLYGVKSCLNASAKTDGQPCLVKGMALPTGSLGLIQKFDAATRSVTLTHHITGGECGNTVWCTTPDYYAVVLGAYNAYGHSVFAIVTSSKVCYGCVY